MKRAFLWVSLVLASIVVIGISFPLGLRGKTTPAPA